KVEVSVSPLGFAINVSDNVFGSIHDKTMFDNNRDFHMKMRAKRPNDYNLLDEGPLRTEYPEEWVEQQHQEGSINVPKKKIEWKILWSY
ncbi:unnamed protein product, partial [Aphanomyces euteiches]